MAGDTVRLEVPIAGMDCAECTQHVQCAIAALPGVQTVDVSLAAEKAVIRLDPAVVGLPAIRKAVEGAGYSVPTPEQPHDAGETPASLGRFTRPIVTLFGLVAGAVLFIAVVGEGLGLFESLEELVPWPVGLALVLVAGYPVLRKVVRATLNRRIISHTLMALGVLAALAVGQWLTALVVVFFMRVGDYVESFTTERARRAVKDLTAMAPQTARVERDGEEQDVPIADVRVGDIVIVRPGETIPVDGEAIDGQATVNQATITGESLPVEVGPGDRVHAATIAQLGHLRVRTTHVGADTTFGRVIKMVEEAELHKADVQLVADKFSAYYLPIVAGIAVLTLAISRDTLAAAAVMLVACSCSFSLATPLAMLASIGAGAKRGLLIKGGRYLELIERADVLLIDKTGTLTLGKPRITDVVALNGLDEAALLLLAASAERYSEHPLAAAVRAAAAERQLVVVEPAEFAALPGLGISAVVDGHTVTIGNRRLVATAEPMPAANDLEAEGKTVLFVARDGELVGVLAAADTPRPEVPAALSALRQLGIKQVELLTGDNEPAARALASSLAIGYRAGLLPEDKIRIVREYQAQGHVVVMIGDGVNDAPALAQAHVGIAMGVAGTDVAMEAAHLALMRDDWMLVPEVFRISRRTMRIVRTNLLFTTIYNTVGITLAAFGFLPPILAAAAQSLPDLGILGNSSRLLRQR